MKRKLLKINHQIKRITDLYGVYETEEGKLIRNIVKGIELDEKLNQVEKLLEEIEAELKKRE